jgi:asparagine N-glycosylation enzyme membrane subunit Stt3
MPKKKKIKKDNSPQPPSPPEEPQAQETEINLGSIRLGSLDPLLIAPFIALIASSSKIWAMIDAKAPSILAALAQIAPYLIAAFAALAAYTIYSRPKDRADAWSWGIPIIMLLAALFSYYSATNGYPYGSDYAFFSAYACICAAFYALAYKRLMDAELAAVLAISISALLLYAVPALGTDLIPDIDSYWHLKWDEGIYYTGFPPEYDPLTYPMMGGIAHHNDTGYTSAKGETSFGLTQKTMPQFMHMFFASIALALQPLGFSLRDIAMLLPTISSSLITVMMYLFIRELFSDLKPFNKIAALAGAFMYSLTPLLASKIVLNPEDEATGMFLVLASLYLFFASLQRRSFLYSLLCGLSLLMLRMVWGGFGPTIMCLGAFGAIYAVIRYLKNKNTLEIVPYFLIPFVIYQLMGLFTHARGGLPIFVYPNPLELYAILSPIVLAPILEWLRTRKSGPQFLEGDTIEARTINLAEAKIATIAKIAIAAIILGFLLYKTPTEWIGMFVSLFYSASGERGIVHQTVAEQNPMAESLSEFFNTGYRQYGLALYMAIPAIILLAYLAYTRAAPGAIFLLIWAPPLMYGAAHKSSWIYYSGVAVCALGASMGLLAAYKKSNLSSIRLIGTILILAIPMAYIPMFGQWNYSKFVGYAVMHMGPTSDIYYWTPALEWHRDHTAPGDAIATWWDYGHWITSVSMRPVIADPLQDDYYEIQDLARFFMNKTTEEDSFEIAKAYNQAYKEHNLSWGLNYVTIDWTMIGKGSALHYIATGDVDLATPGSWKNYVQCQFQPDQSQPSEQLTVGENGSFSRQRQLVFGCQNEMAIVFGVSDGLIKSINVVLPRYGQTIPWAQWSKTEDASLLGVQALVSINQKERVPSILYCAMNWNNEQLQICRLPQFNTLIYVPQEFNDFLMTRLYLGKYLEEYRALGLYNREVTPLKHFRLVPDYNGDSMPDGEFSFGFVRSYEISYDGTFNQTAT